MPANRPPSRPVGPPRPKWPRAKRPETVSETSAGGVVVDQVGPSAKVLLISRIDRRGRVIWSFPKGHVEAGEDYQQTATREVQEETGIEAEVLAPIGEIDFWFMADGKRVHKTVHHFLLASRGGELSDEDPEVESVEWVPIEEVLDRLAYLDERDLLDKARSLMADRVT